MHFQTFQQRSFYIVLLAMFLIHASLMVVHLKDKFDLPQVTKSEVIKLKILQDVAKDLATNQKRQIVQSEDFESKEKVDKAFLSDKDRKFDRQTVAKKIDSFNQAAQGNAHLTQKAQPKQAAAKKPSVKELKLSDFGVAAGEPTPQVADRMPASEMVKGMNNGNPKNTGLSATNDYVQEVTLGDFTHLNTVEYKFYGFFHRIRQKLEQFWGKSIKEKADNLFRSGRRLPASEDLITSLQVTLNANGEIVKVKILGTSGVKELDDAAIESFNQAGPFPNPPSDLLVNGKATIEWGFVVKS